MIGAGGKLVGYAGGLDIKQKLLELEKVGKNGYDVETYGVEKVNNKRKGAI